MAQPAYPTPPEEKGVTSRIGGNLEIDWPRSVGFFGAIGAAVALDLVPIPIALFIASVPFFKLMNRPNAPTPSRVFSQIVDGAAKPVGGDSEGTIHWSDPRPRRASSGRKTSAGGRRRQVRRSRGGSK